VASQSDRFVKKLTKITVYSFPNTIFAPNSSSSNYLFRF